ncbi:hypothetical protein EDD22DRAFT_416103 [Suillus occidentalis]|nr:hypothetical protein EDD22DRAFT_416103 [Suillus occidentalis]
MRHWVTKLVQFRNLLARYFFAVVLNYTVFPDDHTVMSLKKLPPSAEPVVARSLWQSYKALPARTRLYVSMAVCSVGAVGIFVSDYLEEKYPVVPPRTVPTHVAPRNAAGTA